MIKPLLPALAAVTALTACMQTPAETARAVQAAAATQSSLDETLAGLTPGASSTCLPTRASTQVAAYGPTLVYTVSPRLKYRSDTAGGCEQVARGDILVTRSNEGRLCQGDIAQTLDQASRFPSGSCAIGAFVEYRRR